MKVKCVRRSPIQPVGETQNLIHGEVSSDLLTEGKIYTVYALEVRYGRAVLWIASNAGLPWPSPFDASLFFVVSGRISSLWRMSLVPRLWIAPDQWIERGFFADSLTDGQAEEVALFQSMKEFMDLEFDDSEISEAATIIDESWLQCPLCSDAWQSKSIYALVRCVKCASILRNPTYKDASPQL